MDTDDMDVPIPCRRQKRNVTQRNLEPPQAQGGPKRNADTVSSHSWSTEWHVKLISVMWYAVREQETAAQKENRASQPKQQATSASSGGGGAEAAATQDDKKKRKAQPRKAQPTQGTQAKRAPSTNRGRRGTIQAQKKAMPRDLPAAHNLLR
jgi:hypothetical protein